MKTNIKLFATFLFVTFISFGQEKEQEVLLMGTMHTVPKIVKSYPLQSKEY